MRSLGKIGGRAAAALLLAAASGAEAAGPAPQFSFDLRPDTLSRALRDVAVRTGRNLIAPDDLVRSLRSPPLSGRFTAEQAVDRLLGGTGLRYRVVDGTLVIERETAVPDAPESGQSAQIVVTGTNVRSAQPSSPVLTIGRRDIDQSGATSVEQLVRHLPQNLSAGVGQENFGVTGAGSDITEHGAGINLRGLGQRATLVLVDGRRTAPSGTGSFVDVSLIPLSAIDRVEIVTDGASAIYGSDAVAGVVNLVLRKDFRGVEARLDAATSTSGGGDRLLAGVTAGGGWDGGGAMLSYELRSEDEIAARDRSFTINLPDGWSLFPRERRHSLYGVARQQLGSRILFEASGSYAARDTDRSYFVAGPLVPVDAHATARSLGGTASVQLDVGSSWRAEAAASYFRSRTRQQQLQPGGAGLVNLFNTANSVTGVDLKADGDLFDLPAGPFKLALGAQARFERFSSLFRTQVNLPLPQKGKRTVSALFGEVSAPLFSSSNRRPGLERLVLTAAARFEHYESLGSSFDPKVGILWSPLPGLRFRTSYGTSFRAPLLSETLGLYNIFLFPAALLHLRPAEAPPGVGAAVIGSNPDVGPERSTSLTAGADLSPRAIPGLNLRANYYRIRFSNRIALPTQQIVVVGNPALEPIVTRSPDTAFVTDLFSGAAQVLDFSGPGFTPGGARPGDVVVLVDARVANTAETETSGIDLGLDYRFEVGGNRLRVDVNANRVLEFDERLTSASPVIQGLGTPYHAVDWRARVALSWSRGPLSLLLFANYTNGYRDNRSAAERRVGSFTTFDGGLAYDGPEETGPPLLRRLRIAFHVENLLDEDPPLLRPDPGSTRGIGYDPVNATGRGRILSVQLRKSW